MPAFITNTVHIQRYADAVYGVQVGSATLAQVNQDITSLGGIDKALNAYFIGSGQTNATVAANIVKNVGIVVGGTITAAAVTDATAYVLGQLNANKGNEGATIKNILNLVGNLTADPIYGAAAVKFNADVDNAIAYTGAGDVIAGSVIATVAPFTLTTGSDNLPGTSNNDTFNALIDQATAANSTINASDIISGGAGSDTLTITGVGTTLDVLNSATVTGIETVNIRATTANSLNASAISGLTAVNSTGAGTVLVTNLAAGASIGIVGNGSLVQGEVAFAPATAASAITLNISGGVAQTAANVGITAAATIAAGAATGTATTATVNSTGAANTTGIIDLANATLTSVTINAATNLTANFLSQATDQVATGGTLTVSGAATLVTLSAALDNDLATINASGMTAGGISATLGTLQTITVTGGAGADTITTGAVLTTGTVNAGAGTDILGVAADAHITATVGAKYTNFETLRLTSGVTVDASNVAGITAIETLGVATVTNMTATQAASVTMRANATAGTADALNLQLAAQSGTSDALTITAGLGTTTTGALDIAALTVTGFEILNLRAAPGPTSTAGAGGAGDRTTNITGTITGATLREINLTGTAVNIANVATTVPVTINGSALTGDGRSASTQAGLTVAGSAVVGSTITGSAVRDVFTIGAEGSAYNGGDGNDSITTTVALLVADGVTDGTINGGNGTDTLTVSDTTGVTLTDNHFTKLSNMETLALTATGAGDVSVTLGGTFNAAFASGATITTGKIAATQDVTFAGGLSNVNITLTVDADLLVGTAAETHSLVTGSGNDTVTFAGDATYVGVAGATGTIVISTGAGADTISLTHGQLLANTTSQTATITGGTGADTITKGAGSLNSTTVQSTTVFVMAAGDSGTTLATQDKITGFQTAGVAANTLSDVLNFEGTATVSAFTASADFGAILTHSITGGIATFDTAATFAAAKIVNANNLADVVGYLNANLGVNETVGFLFDSNGDGANDATMVFHQGSNLTTVADDLVQLVGVTGLSLNATLTTVTAGCIAVA